MKIHLSKILKEKELSISQLQKLTGISRSTLTPLSKSEILPSKTRFDTIEKICENLKLSESELLSFNDEWEFKIERVVPLDKVNIDYELQQYFIVFFSAKRNDIIKKFCLDLIITFVYPPEFDQEDLEFRFQHSPSYRRFRTDEQSKQTFEEEEKEFQTIHHLFLKKLDEKYKKYKKLDSIHFSSITNFDLDILKTYNTNLYNEIIEFSSNFDLFELINSNSCKNLFKKFIIENNLNSVPYVSHGENDEAKILFISLKYNGSDKFLHRLAEYNKQTDEVYFKQDEPFTFSGVTKAYNIERPSDNIHN
ncbi:helix-turn-helix domain-containing protein [Enterococcus dongliensis]|uniref:helix-turn-helix domain-containing protein n=1 Tax=Enterococcus dongliensis TaxID=2559925 RepID=UPI002891058E|nr:helix-turn-helix transcriptional regulator [Enterococcus dongliensis]MDT2612773.1 helix-turn-helix transcriptional regulator [Enterococcus dongliensis]